MNYYSDLRRDGPLESVSDHGAAVWVRKDVFWIQLRAALLKWEDQMAHVSTHFLGTVHFWKVMPSPPPLRAGSRGLTRAFICLGEEAQLTSAAEVSGAGLWA